MKKKNKFVITCEHGGNKIPPPYQSLFCNYRSLLETHEGYDIGAIEMAKQLAKILKAPLIAATTSRLLIDLNRSVTHRDLYSPITRTLPKLMQQEISNEYYLPYRKKAESSIKRMIKKGYQVIHISCHSFTPRLKGRIRKNDIGLLYDPARSTEKIFCHHWKKLLKLKKPGLKIRMNYPYTGKSDGLTSYLRRNFTNTQYLGIELEINQKHIRKNQAQWKLFRKTIIEALCSSNPCK